jgi:hypothetical protein
MSYSFLSPAHLHNTSTASVELRVQGLLAKVY